MLLSRFGVGWGMHNAIFGPCVRDQRPADVQFCNEPRPLTHLRYANQYPDAQRDALFDIVQNSTSLMTTLRTARSIDLPDWWLVSGAIYNQVWNALTGRPELYGVKDIDLFYFDADTTYEAEDIIVKRVKAAFVGPTPVDVRNQARVHLWFQERFGHPCPAYANAREPIANFACTTHAVALRLRADDSFDLCAPFGLNDIFGFRLTPNTALPNRATHEAKAARQVTLWPELTVIPWPEDVP
jgi:uncharacterized protein